MAPIVQAILQKISKSIDTLVKRTEKLNEVPIITTSDCIICNSSNMYVRNTRKRKNKYTYRLCICMDCGSENKQIINTVSVKPGEDILTLSDDKVKSWYKPLTIIIENDKVSIDRKLHKNKMWKLVFGKVFKEMYKISENYLQHDYDTGLFEAARKSVDPISIRITHKYDSKNHPVMSSLWKSYMGIDKKYTITDHVYNGIVTYRQLDKNKDSYYINITKVAIIPRKDLDAKRKNKNK